MSGQIFVPLRKHDQAEEILPYLCLLARPAMQVVFLTPYREKASWMQVQLTAMQTGIRAITVTTALAASASRQAHLRSVQERIRPVRNALHNNGVNVVIHCYSGSLRSAIASLRDVDNEIIVLLSERTLIARLVAQARRLFGSLRARDAAPILFLRPSRQH